LTRVIQFYAIYTDFQKAFNKVNHSLLFLKLKYFSFKGYFLSCLYSYLISITQIVKISFHYSNKFSGTSGVLQGSHLGPFIFLIFINDLPSILDSSVNILMFTDDVKLYCQIKSSDDHNFFQSNLNKLVLWSERNYLSLNHDKCKIITFSRNKSVIRLYFINKYFLERWFSIKDLGNYFEFNLSFKLYHNMIINKSYKMLGFINRNTRI
jgi:hypothetical protein